MGKCRSKKVTELWSSEISTGPLHFWAGCCKRRLNPALVFLWLPCITDAYIIFLSCFYLFSSPNLSGRRLDVCHTSTHGVALVRIRMQVWNVLCAARWKSRTQKIAKKSPSGHHDTTLSGHIFATKARIDYRKKNLLIMVALCNRADHYIFIPFLSFFFFLLFFPHLISAVGDWMFTILWHMVWP